MKTRLHLVSTFGPNMLQQPSIQLAVLKAFVDRAAIPQLSTTTHSAFACVPFHAWPVKTLETAQALCEYGEYPFSLLCLSDFAREQLVAAGTTVDELLRRVNRRPEFRGLSEPLTKAHLERLRHGTLHYVAQRIAGSLDPDAVNIFGFTTDLSQVFSSAYFARTLLAQFPGHRLHFILGGGAASLPETGSAFRALEIEAHCVEGEGELALERICRNVTALAPDATHDDVRRALRSVGSGVHALAQVATSIAASSLNTQLPNLSELPLPDFSDYFDEVKELSPEMASGDFSLPMEGSRGCYAKCNFCSNPHSWSGYRKLTGAQVMDRCTQLFNKHPFSYVTFVDVTCDPWASEYARLVIESGEAIPSVMQFRAHHTESYFTRMALAGLEHVQVGVEALSPSLLAQMEKGTRVVQNLLAHKYLAELKIQQWNNLITAYPGSTLEDIAETRRVLQLTPHFGPYGLSPLALRAGSPLFDRALAEGKTPTRERGNDDVDFPPGLEDFDDAGVQRAPPPEWLPQEIARAWRDFEDWYDAFKEEKGDSVCEVTSVLGGRLRILDTRSGESQVTILEGDDARVLDACHAGPDRDALMTLLHLDKTRLETILVKLSQQRFLLETEGHLVALPLRTRDALVRNHIKTLGEPR